MDPGVRRDDGWCCVGARCQGPGVAGDVRRLARDVHRWRRDTAGVPTVEAAHRARRHVVERGRAFGVGAAHGVDLGSARLRRQNFGCGGCGAGRGGRRLVGIAARTHSQQAFLQPAVRRQLRGLHLLRDAAVDHHADAVRHVDRYTQVLLDQQHRDLALLREVAQRLLHLLDDQRRQAFGGLVHHQELRLEQQRAADRQHLLLSARKLCAAVALALGQAREHAVDAIHIAALARHQTQRLVDAQRRPDAPPLRNVGDAAFRDLVGRSAENFFAEQLHAAGRAHQAGDRVAQRRLAHAVAADDAEHAVFDHQTHALQRVGAAVIDVQALDREHGRSALGLAVVVARG